MQNSSEHKNIVVKADPELADIIPGFLENRRQDIKDMLNALEQGDFEKIERFGHSMKGCGGGYGFDAITNIGDLIEKAAKIERADEIRKLIVELSKYLENVEVVYE